MYRWSLAHQAREPEMAEPLVLGLTKCLRKVFVVQQSLQGKAFGRTITDLLLSQQQGGRQPCMPGEGGVWLQCATTMGHKTSRKSLVQDIFTTQLGMSAKGRERALGEMKGGVGMWMTFAIALTLNEAPFPSGTLRASPGKVSRFLLAGFFLPGVLMIPGVRVCALGLHRGSQHHAVHGHIHLPQGLFHHGCH